MLNINSDVCGSKIVQYVANSTVINLRIRTQKAGSMYRFDTPRPELLTWLRGEPMTYMTQWPIDREDPVKLPPRFQLLLCTTFSCSQREIGQNHKRGISVYPRDASKREYSLCICLSVCTSATSRCSTEMDKRRIKQTTPHDSSGNLVFWRQKFRQIQTGSPPTKAPNAGGVG